MSDYIPIEVVTEILKRLPVKCLLRLRCVCKEWCSIISSPAFITRQLSHSSCTEPRILVRCYSQQLSEETYAVYDDDDTFSRENSFSISFPFHERLEHYYHIVGYCNGVLCLSDDFFWLKKTDHFVLWNPSIRRAVTLPNPDLYRSSMNSMLALGFGYDSMNNDFKVVRLAYFLNNDESCHKLPPIVEVFSLSKGTWSRLNNNVECYISDHCWSQAYMCNSVHWVAFKMINNNSGRRHHSLILKFDFSSEIFVELELPEELTSVSPIATLATMMRGRLAIVHNDIWLDHSLQNDIGGSCAIWVMREYNDVNSWCLVFRVKSVLDFYRVLNIKKSGIVFARRNGKLYFYNFQNKEVKKTRILGTTYSFLVDKYVESLFLLGHGTEVWATEPKPDCEYEFETVESEEIRIMETKTDKIYSLYLQSIYQHSWR